jgi:hypothetical protein
MYTLAQTGEKCELDSMRKGMSVRGAIVYLMYGDDVIYFQYMLEALQQGVYVCYTQNVFVFVRV